MAITPLSLKPGDRIAVVSPAGPVGADETQRGAAVLRALGFDVHVLPGALRQGTYLAGEDEQRAFDITQTLLADEFDGVICSRGGYGSMRLLPLLDWGEFDRRVRRVPFIGFSDITALQTTLWQEAGWISFSGPQLARGFGSPDKGESFGGLDRFTGESFLKTIAGEMWGEVLPMPEGEFLKVMQDGPNPIGPLLGGNLAVLAALCGTPWQPRFAGGIVLLEEIDEPVYRLDRTITQLVQSGAFDGARGVLLGRFSQHVKGERLDHSEEAARILADHLPELPIVTGAPYGHVGPIWTVPIGAGAVLDLDQQVLVLESEIN